jgi:integrase
MQCASLIPAWNQKPLLSKSEVLLVLQALPRRWRPLFGVAFTTGLRKGELLGLRCNDVNLAAGLLTVRYNWDRPRTKSGRIEGIPLSSEAREWLQVALERSEGHELVFPAPNGRMFRRDVDLASIHRRAVVSAGLIAGFAHKCRRKGCGYREEASDGEERRCPKCSMRLWPTPCPRAGTVFHTTRHVYATELLDANVSIAAAQKLLRHSTPTLTLNTYGHLAPGYLREEAERLRFFPLSPASETKFRELRASPRLPKAPQKPPLDTNRAISAAQASEVLVRARRESNPRPSDSKSDALSD